MDLVLRCSELVAKVREKRPLVYHLTNFVTAESCANICLAAGASPLMGNEVQEVNDIIEQANALVLNIGTLEARTVELMHVAQARARELKLPIVLDPVGVMATSYRLAVTQDLLKSGVTILKGNYAEISCLNGGALCGRGVDSLGLETDKVSLAQLVAAKFHTVVCVTGKVDVVSDGKRTVSLTNGTELLTHITGAGCMTGSLMGAYSAVTEDALVAAVTGLSVMNVAAEKAAVYAQGPGSFKVALLDEVARMTRVEGRGLRVEENVRGDEERGIVSMQYTVYSM